MMLFVLLFGVVAAIDPLIAEICQKAPHISSLAANWCSTTVPVCEWAGVTCFDFNNAKKELEVFLADLPLSIDVSLEGLKTTELQSVTLNNCDLRGSLRSVRVSPILKRLSLVGNTGLTDFVDAVLLNSLLDLNLKNCGLTADISETLCDIKDPMTVSSIEIADNRLTGDLSRCSGGVGLMHSVRYFNVSGNALSGRAPVPVNSVWLDLSNNQFDSIEEVSLAFVVPKAEVFKHKRQPLMSKCKLNGNKNILTAQWQQFFTRCTK
jgi:hypothetical protein